LCCRELTTRSPPRKWKTTEGRAGTTTHSGFISGRRPSVDCDRAYESRCRRSLISSIGQRPDQHKITTISVSSDGTYLCTGFPNFIESRKAVERLSQPKVLSKIVNPSARYASRTPASILHPSTTRTHRPSSVRCSAATKMMLKRVCRRSTKKQGPPNGQKTYRMAQGQSAISAQSCRCPGAILFSYHFRHLYASGLVHFLGRSTVGWSDRNVSSIPIL
jgi:hypothetical protein